MNPTTITFILGILGTLFILIAFVLDEFSRLWRQNSVRYNLLNIIGSALLLYYAWSLSAWPFVILNGIWLVVAIVKLTEVEYAHSQKRRK